MRKALSIAAIVATVSVAILAPGVANAEGCLKGAAVGGVAGHVAGHHAVLGAAAGCVVEHHREKAKDKAAAKQAAEAQRNGSVQAAPAPVSTHNRRGDDDATHHNE